MKPPRHVKVSPHTYSLRLTDRLPNAVGECDRDRLTIHLATDQAPTAMRDTVVHEIVHACMGVLKLEDDQEEAICLALAPQLLGVIRDNPDLIGWLQR